MSDPMTTTIKREPTDRSPAVDFDFAHGHFTMSGESYPEDAAGFFGPLLQGMREFVGSGDTPAQVDIEMAYFNSSSAKALMNLFQLLEQAAAAGRKVVINWR